MEQCFKIALWMFVLIGSLQAMPVCSSSSQTLPSYDIEDLGLSYTKTEVKCGSNVTLIAPKNIETMCHTAALELFIEGLEQVEDKCEDVNGRVSELLEQIRDTYPNNSKCSHPEQCAWGIQEFGQQLVGFVEAFEKFLTKLETSTRTG